MKISDKVENQNMTSCEERPVTRAEVEALRQRLAVLEAIVPGSRWSLRQLGTTKILALLVLVVALAGVTILHGQGTADALFIDPKGNVGIGSTSPAQKLDVAGTIRSSTGGFQFPDGTTQITAAVPAHAVMAFNLATCPPGWSDYTPAYGRFIRGIDKSGRRIDDAGQRSPSSFQEDAIRNITGSIWGVSGAGHQAWNWGFRPGTRGAFWVPDRNYQDGRYNKYAGDYNAPGGVGEVADFNASRAPGVLTANENRPKNVALLYCQKN